MLFATAENEELKSIADELLPNRVSTVMAKCTSLAVQLLTHEDLDVDDLKGLLSYVKDALVVDAGVKDLQEKRMDIDHRITLMDTIETLSTRAANLEKLLPQLKTTIDEATKGGKEMSDVAKKSIEGDFDNIKKTADTLQDDITRLQAQVQRLGATSDFVRQFIPNSTDLSQTSSLKEGVLRETLDSLVKRVDVCLDTEADYEGKVNGSADDALELERYKVFVEEIRNLPGYKENPSNLKTDVMNEFSDLIILFKRKTGIKDTRDAKVMWSKVNRFMASSEPNVALKKEESQIGGVDSSNSSLVTDSTIIWKVLEQAEDPTTLAKLIRKNPDIVKLTDPIVRIIDLTSSRSC